MTTSCICPESLEQLFMIEYPGFVKNPDKALDTLGGLKSVEKVFESQKDRLELKFRKSDPLAHAAYGDRVPKKCLVLRIQRKRSSPDERQASTSESSGFDLSVVGKIQVSFKFDTLAEFQWLPMQRTNPSERLQNALHEGVTIKRTPESLNPKYKSILDEVLPIKDPFDNTFKSFNPDAPLLILPAVFSRFDTPREIHQPHPKFRSQEMRAEFERQQEMSIIGRTRKKRSTMSYLLNFSEPIPEKPHDKLLKDRTIMSPQEENLLPKLEKCFEKQKVWSKAALCFELKCSALDVKYILPLVAFHYLTGPFRTMWVKYGYNPLIDQSSKVLQSLDFRVKNPLDQQEYSRRSINTHQLPMKRNSDRGKFSMDLKTIISTTQNLDDTLDDANLGAKGSTITEEMCIFRKDLIPAARQLSYQLKDIEIDEVQAIVHSNDGREPTQCSEKDGWLAEGSIERIRKIMTKTLQDLITAQLEEG